MLLSLMLIWSLFFVSNTNTQTYACLYSQFHLKVHIKDLIYTFLSIYPSTHFSISLSSSCVYYMFIFLFEILGTLLLVSFLILMSWKYVRMNLGMGLFYSFWLTLSEAFHSEHLNLTSTAKIFLLFSYYSSSTCLFFLLMDAHPSSLIFCVSFMFPSFFLSLSFLFYV